MGSYDDFDMGRMHAYDHDQQDDDWGYGSSQSSHSAPWSKSARKSNHGAKSHGAKSHKSHGHKSHGHKSHGHKSHAHKSNHGRKSSSRQQMPAPPRQMPAPPRQMPSPPRQMPRMTSHSRSSNHGSSSSSMNPMMMMMLPHLMGQDSSAKQNPMNMMVLASLMKSSNQGSDYDYDYGYDYDGSSDYDYDYVDDDSQGASSPSPLSSIIQQMIQQKLAGHTPAVQVSLNPKAVEPTHTVEVATPGDASDSMTLEIAQPRPQDKGAHPSEQVSYRNAP